MKQRIIQFRVWDNIAKKMNIDNMDCVISVDRNGVLNSNNGFGTNPVMQYTGLKDKNGKDIYEGDIVLKESGHYITVVEFGTFQIGMDQNGNIPYATTGFVCSFKDGYGYTGLNTKASDAHGFACEEVEVIGNIYENHELIKKQS